MEQTNIVVLFLMMNLLFCTSQAASIQVEMQTLPLEKLQEELIQIKISAAN